MVARLAGMANERERERLRSQHISLMSVKPTRINRAAGRRKIRASRWNSIGMRIKPFRDSLESET